MFGIKITRRIITGLAFIYAAGLCWIAEFIVPFTNLPNKLAVFTALLIAGEILFIIGVAILGKPLYNDLKTRLKAAFKQRRP